MKKIFVFILALMAQLQAAELKTDKPKIETTWTEDDEFLYINVQPEMGFIFPEKYSTIKLNGGGAGAETFIVPPANQFTSEKGYPLQEILFTVYVWNSAKDNSVDYKVEKIFKYVSTGWLNTNSSTSTSTITGHLLNVQLDLSTPAEFFVNTIKHQGSFAFKKK